MKNNEFNFDIPKDSYPKALGKSNLVQTYNKNKEHFEQAVKDQRKDWPEYMTLKVVTVYIDNTFDLATPDGEHLFERVGAIDPRAKDYYQAGKAVTVRFHNVNGGRPYIKFGYGFMGDVKDVSIVPAPPSIKYWTQSKGSWLQNQHAPDACRFYSPWDTTGTPLYTFYTKEGSLSDIRAKPYGLVSYRDQYDNSRLAVAYMVFSADGSFTKYHKIDVIDLTGTLVHQYSWDSTATYPFGNFDSYSHFSINPTNSHFTLIPSYGTESILLRAWEDGDGFHSRTDTITNAGYTTAAFKSFAHDNILWQAYNIVYDYPDYGSLPNYYVFPLPIPTRTETCTGGLKGYTRTAKEGLNIAFDIKPTDLSTLPPGSRRVTPILGAYSEAASPASISADAWIVVSSETDSPGNAIFTDASWAALANSYNIWAHTRPSLNVGIIIKALLHIHKLSAIDGSKLWVYTISATPTQPLATEGFLTPTEQYFQDHGPASVDPTLWGGRVTENSRNNLSPIDPGGDPPWPSIGPGFITAPFSWPRYDYLGGGIALMPQAPNRIRATRAYPGSTPYYSGQVNALPVIQSYSMNTYPQQAVYSDPQGNLYFTYCKPKNFLLYGKVSYNYDFRPAYTVIEGHFPTIATTWTTHQVSLSADGSLRWERDLTQWEEIPYWTSRSEYSITVVGGTSGITMPIVNNVPLQLPCSKHLLVLREIRGLGAAYRPDLWLEVVNSVTGENIQFIYLPMSFDTLSTDIDVDGIEVANAGERNYYVSDCKIRTATTAEGVDWCAVYTIHATHDTTISGAEHHIDLYYAPLDGSIGTWSAGGSWIPSAMAGDNAPYQQFWDTLCVSDGSMTWAQGYSGGDWQIYKRDL